MNKVNLSKRYTKTEKAAERELDAWLMSIGGSKMDILQELRNELGN